MTTFLYTLIIKPIELLIELLFSFFYKPFDSYGLSIVAISVFVGLLTLPLYHAAEKLQQKERNTRISLKDGIARIKSTFSGDEQYLMLSTYYRQNNYHPLYSLRNSFNLVIQIPFFIAAYHFLSNLPHLQGEGFFFIKDLGQPDGLLHIAGYSINLLPIFMTAINIITGAVYTRGFPLRDKIQLYGMAAIFLVLLYSSPSALALYWTLNNVFSLVKTLFYKLKHPLWILYALASGGSIVLALAIIMIKPNLPRPKHLVLIVVALGICSIPLVIKLIQIVHKRFLSDFSLDTHTVNRLFLVSVCLLWILFGMVLPGNLIHSSPIEFSFVGAVDNPLSFIGHTAAFFFGLWVLWPLLFFFMSSKGGRSLFAFFFFVLSLTALANVFIFFGSYGHLNTLLMFDNPALLLPSFLMTLLPILCCLFIAVLGLLLIKRHHTKIVLMALSILLLGSAASSAYSMVDIGREFKAHKKNLAVQSDFDASNQGLSPMISLSKTEKNVVILFLDRAINSFFPLIVDEFPHLAEQYAGFTYYPNTVSYSAYTIGGAPAMMAGYEYTPEAINERSGEKLVDKHNEATLVLPRLFSEAGYTTTIFDPPFANYQWSDDFSAFAPYPEIGVYRMLGRYSLQYKNDHEAELDWNSALEGEIIKNKLPMYSLFKAVFPILRSMIYDQGTYFLMGKNPQLTDAFLDSYAVLHYLPQITSFDSDAGSFVFLTNDTTHEPMFLQAPDYIPQNAVTDTTNPLQADSEYDDIDQIHYHANAAALLQIGHWLEYLKQEGVYDNTRIIIVSDHGRHILTPVFKEFENNRKTLGYYNPLLLVKDFGAIDELHEDLKFMTNADVPLFAIDGLPVSEVNPFTQNNLFEMEDKSAVDCYFISADPKDHRGNTFLFDYNLSFRVTDSIFDEDNWSQLERK